MEKYNKIQSFDTGPGNCLIDQWIKRNTKLEFDSEGLLAKSGKVNENVLKKFLESPFYKKKLPKSLDVRDFSLENLNELSLEDGSATLSMLTVKSICISINSFSKIPNIILFSGILQCCKNNEKQAKQPMRKSSPPAGFLLCWADSYPSQRLSAVFASDRAR